MTQPRAKPCRAGTNPLDDMKNSLKFCMILVSYVAQYAGGPIPLALEVSVENQPIRVRIPSFLLNRPSFYSFESA